MMMRALPSVVISCTGGHRGSGKRSMSKLSRPPATRSVKLVWMAGLRPTKPLIVAMSCTQNIQRRLSTSQPATWIDVDWGVAHVYASLSYRTEALWSRVTI